METNTDNHLHMAGKSREAHFCFMIAPVARCLSMMLECNYLLREDKQLMECHQQKLHLQHTMIAAYQAGHCWAQATTASIELPSPNEWGLNKNTDGGGMGSSLDNSTRGYTSLQRTDTMWLQERQQRTLQSDRKLLSSALHFNLLQSVVNYVVTDFNSCNAN